MNMFRRSVRIVRRGRQSSEAGMALIELMIAMVVLATGVSAGLGLIFAAMLSNSRTKRDTGATLVAQTVMEKLLLAGSATSTPIPVTDCQNNAFTINPVGTTAGTGAALDATTGNINFAVAPNPAVGYSMAYAGCSVNGATIKYDVRWNIKILDTVGNQPATKLITVAARPNEQNLSGSKSLRLFTLPVTLRGVATLNSN